MAAVTICSDFGAQNIRSDTVSTVSWSATGAGALGAAALGWHKPSWRGLPFPSPGNLPDPGIEPGSSAMQADSPEPPGDFNPIISWQIDGETVATVSDFILGGSKISADGDCSHEIKRRLLLGRKVMTNLDSIFKSRDITLQTKVRLVGWEETPHIRGQGSG